MSECGAASIYCSDDQEWTFHCTAPEGHTPGLHEYTLDPGQPPLPTTTEG